MEEYVCLDCGANFEEPKTEQEPHEFWGASCYEDFSVCPQCGSTNIEEYEEVVATFRNETCDYCKHYEHEQCYLGSHTAWNNEFALVECENFVEREK